MIPREWPRTRLSALETNHNWLDATQALGIELARAQIMIPMW